MYNLTPIGVIHSSLKRLADCPLQEDENSPEAWIELFDKFGDAANNLKPGDEVVLLTWLHEADRSTLKTKPRNEPDAPLTGVFSTRSPDRPNPIGIHYTTVTSIQENVKIRVSALEVLDQTPLIDVKIAWKEKS